MRHFRILFAKEMKENMRRNRTQILGVVFLRERLTIADAGGMALVLAGIWGVLGERRRVLGVRSRPSSTP